MTINAINITGLTEIQAQLRDLPEKISRRVVQSALRAGANVIKKQIQATVPVRTGVLRKGFKVKRSKIHSTQTDQGVYLTLKTGRGRHDPKDPFYGKFQEGGYTVGVRHIYGTRIRVRKGVLQAYQKRIGSRLTARHFVEGKHFIAHAFEAKKAEAVAVIIATAEAKIEQLTRNIGH